MNLTPRLNEAFQRQLNDWQDAKKRYEALKDVEVRRLAFSDAPLWFQHNPARAVSTAAKTDPESIKKRPCFLCSSNRPAEQTTLEEFGTYEVLLNPFPIFDFHLTIVDKQHRHQDAIDFSDMAQFAAIHPGLTTFYNGSRSGASAPDHLHFQATRTESLPLCDYLLSNPGKLLAKQDGCSFYMVDSPAAKALHVISKEFSPLIEKWLTLLLPQNPDEGAPDKSMRNLLIWIDDKEFLHTVLYPRSKHRPDCYNVGRLVSPGAVDMTGLLILPNKEDFDEMSPFEAARILDEVSYDFTTSTALKNLLLQ